MKWISSLGIVILLLPNSVVAADMRASESVYVDESVEDDLYVAGERVEVRTGVRDDLWVLGGRIDVISEIGQDAGLIGQRVIFGGEIGDDLKLIGESVRLLENAKVRGDAFIAGQNVELEGVIEGDVWIAATSVTITKTAKILGNIHGWVGAQPVIDEGAEISGEVNWQINTERPTSNTDWLEILLTQIWTLVIWIVTALVGLAVAGKVFRRGVMIALSKPGQVFGTGLVVMLLAIPLALVLLLSTAGAVLGVVVFLLAGLVGILGCVGGIYWLGIWLMRVLNRDKKLAPKLSWREVVVGAIGWSLVWSIPIIGWLVGVLIWLGGVGAVSLASWKLIRE